MSHVFSIRVYYEDTDLAGIVYYANYLKFIERARTEFLRALGLDQARLKVERGLAFAVRRMEADFVLPARFDDLIEVATGVRELSGARAVLRQVVRRDGQTLFTADVMLVCMSESGRPARLPEELRKSLRAAFLTDG